MKAKKQPDRQAGSKRATNESARTYLPRVQDRKPIAQRGGNARDRMPHGDDAQIHRAQQRMQRSSRGEVCRQALQTGGRPSPRRVQLPAGRCMRAERFQARVTARAADHATLLPDRVAALQVRKQKKRSTCQYECAAAAKQPENNAGNHARQLESESHTMERCMFDAALSMHKHNGETHHARAQM
jgi:hypothetical protein